MGKCLLGAIALLMTVCSGTLGADPDPDRSFHGQWLQFKARYVAADGRVIDTGNGNVSHSEGQGYGLLFALNAGDRQTFARIWQWTVAQLQTRPDHLFMWRRRISRPLDKEDQNNATDGDILIAWALLGAAERWHDPDYRQAALSTLSDIRGELIRSWRGQPILIPGKEGFHHGETYTINLSYWVLPALEAFSHHDPDPIWQELIASGLELIGRARFGRWGLPPDWLELGEDLALPTGRTPVFGYNAVRIPIYLIWSGHADRPALQPYLEFWDTFSGFTPAWTDLANDCIDSYDAPAGVHTVRALIAFAAGQLERFDPAPIADSDDYYSASLSLLSTLAAQSR